MKKLMKKSVGASLLAVILVFSLCMSFVAFADEETVSVETETGAETVEEAAVEKTAYEPLPPIEMIEEESETKEEKEQTEETDESSSEVIIERLAKVKKILADLEKNEELDVKEAYNQYKKLETAEEKTAFVNALSEENNKIFQEYLEAKAEEQELLTKIAAVAEKDPEAAQIIEVEADLKFAEEEIAAAEAEIAAMEEEAASEEVTEETTTVPTEEKTVETTVQASEELTEEATEDDATELGETKTETVDQESLETESTEEKDTESLSVEETEKVSTEETVTEETTAEESPEEVAEEETTEKAETSEVVETAETEEATAEDTAKETSESESEESADDESPNEESTVAEVTDIETEIEDPNAEEPAEKKIDLWYEYENQEMGQAFYGQEITICSALTGYPENVNLQWAYSTDGENYEPIEGATSDTFTFILDEVNSWYYWDLLVTEA